MNHFTGAVIAEPVEEVLGTAQTGTVRGSGPMYAYIEVDGFVIALTAPMVPLMPNGISVTEHHGLQVFSGGSRVEIDRMKVSNAHARVSLNSATSWDPSLPQLKEAAEAIHNIACETWCRLGLAHTDSPQRMVEQLSARRFAVCADAGGREGLLSLFDSIARRDEQLARRASSVLLGRGPGLTPEGDDFLAAAAATLYTCMYACDWGLDQSSAWGSAVLPADIRGRTSSLSATLLELAVQGQVSRPVQVLLDVDAGPVDRVDALKRLEKVGHGTGRAWASGCAATAILATLSARTPQSSANPR